MDQQRWFLLGYLLDFQFFKVSNLCTIHAPHTLLEDTVVEAGSTKYRVPNTPQLILMQLLLIMLHLKISRANAKLNGILEQ